MPRTIRYEWQDDGQGGRVWALVETIEPTDLDLERQILVDLVKDTARQLMALAEFEDQAVTSQVRNAARSIISDLDDAADFAALEAVDVTGPFEAIRSQRGLNRGRGRPDEPRRRPGRNPRRP